MELMNRAGFRITFSPGFPLSHGSPVVSRFPKSLNRAVTAVYSEKKPRNYALALATLARSNNVLEDVRLDVNKLSNFLENKSVHDFLKNPMLETDKRKARKAVVKQIAKEADFHAYTLNLLCILVDTNRTDVLKEIIWEFEGIYNVMTGTGADYQLATTITGINVGVEEGELHVMQ